MLGLREPSHWLVLALIIVLLFGWKRLPDAARSIGRSLRIFKAEVQEMKEDGKSAAASETVPGETVTPEEQPSSTTGAPRDTARTEDGSVR